MAVTAKVEKAHRAPRARRKDRVRRAGLKANGTLRKGFRFVPGGHGKTVRVRR